MRTSRPLGKLTRDVADAPAVDVPPLSDGGAEPVEVGVLSTRVVGALAPDAEWPVPRSCCTATTRPVIALINAAAAVSIPGSVCHQLRLAPPLGPSPTPGIVAPPPEITQAGGARAR